MQEKQLTVSEYLNVVNSTLGLIPQETQIIGEVVDFRVSQGKWVNFDLKDEEVEAKISCFMTTFQMQSEIESGMKVQVTGYPKVYERFGKFSLNVKTILPVGEGALAKAYEMLKKKLQAEGLFDSGRKRAIPSMPSKIGLITSGEAAAYGDFMRILNNRWSGVTVVHAAVHVQGKNAVPEILEAFESFNDLPEEERPEVLVLTRGGGSLEDLHAFNDEAVARAVFQSKIPVVVGVGHERDESLADFVADVRASTPSNAAERVVPDRQDILRQVQMTTDRMESLLRQEIIRQNHQVERSLNTFRRYIESHIQDVRQAVERFQFAFDRFRISLVNTRQYIEQNEGKIRRVFDHVLQKSRSNLDHVLRLLKQFDVQVVLDRGFSILRKHDKIVRDAAELKAGDEVQVQLGRGQIDAKIT